MAVMEKDPRAEEAIRRWGELKTERARFEQDWEDIARLIRPQRGGFSLSDHTTRVHEKPLSSAPIIAQSTFAGELYSTITNPANRWMGLKTTDPDLNDWQPMREWLHGASSRILASFRPAVSGFYDASLQLYSDIAAFGNSAQYDEAVPGERMIMDVTLSLAECVWDIDAYGRVIEVVRKFQLRPRAAVRMFDGKGELPARLHEMAEKGSTDKLTFYQHVLRNESWLPGQLGARGKDWLSRYVCEINATLVRESGYDEMPFYAPRWDVESGQTYGTGPGFVALPSARTVHRMDDATIRAAQNAADPTKLAPDRDVFPLHGRIRPGEIIYGGVNARGEPMIRSLDQHANIGLTIEEKRQKIEEIKDAFHWTLLSLAGRTGLNELEVMEIQAQRQRLWAPHMGRVQKEYLAPKIARRFAMLWKAGQLPPPPDVPRDVGLQIDYQSAAAAAQKSAEAASMVRIVNDIAPLAQAKPRLMDRIDADGYIEALAEARGVPPGFILSRENADKIAEARAQAQAQAQQMEMAERGVGMLRDAAQALPQGGAA